MATKNKNNQLALNHNNHHISSFDPSSVGCSPFFGNLRLRNVAIANNNRQEQHKSSLTSSKSFKTIRHHEDEAAMSPKIGCMGQIKKSGKGSNRKGTRVEDDYSRQAIGVAGTMDPPLPVSKCNGSDRDTKVDSLWKRRHGSGCKDLDSLDVVHLRHGFDGTGDLQA